MSQVLTLKPKHEYSEYNNSTVVRLSYVLPHNYSIIADYGSYYEDYDYCSTPDHAHVNTGECSHNEFFSLQKIKEMKSFAGSDVKFCCENHEYVFKDLCKVKTFLRHKIYYT